MRQSKSDINSRWLFIIERGSKGTAREEKEESNMKNWKRLAALGMSATMLLSLAGCSTTTSTGDTGDAAAGGDAAATADSTSGGGGDLEGAHVFMFKSNTFKARYKLPICA